MAKNKYPYNIKDPTGEKGLSDPEANAKTQIDRTLKRKPKLVYA